jgi:hypothetical protein
MTPENPSLVSSLRETLRRSPVAWARACGITLRPYQVEIALAVKDSILHHRGLTFVVVLPRQSGKNELQAHLFAWLLFRYSRLGCQIVSVSPTFKPQTTTAMLRVSRSLDTCLGTRGRWQSSKGYIYRFNKSSLQFFSGESRAKVVGATADLLLSVDEAQDVPVLKFDKDFDPMTASTNATRIFWGTAWTSNTLLERERRLALQAQQQDGIRRLFHYTADDVVRLVPPYAEHLKRMIALHGRDHPGVRSQYFGETIDVQSGMFTPARLSLIISPLPKSAGFGEGSGVGLGPGVEPALNGAGLSSVGAVEGPSSVLGPPSSSAFLLDVAGMDESRLDPLHASGLSLGNPGRDSTALSIVSIDLSTLKDLGHPTYHVLARHSWVGENHLAVFGKLKSLAGTWNPQHIVIDATGVGEGLWSLLDHAFPSRVIPVKFTQQEKSEIGWRFLSIIETGRFRDHVHTDPVRLQYAHCTCEVLPGPQNTLRWGVPDGTRGPDGQLIHDDFILADSLVSRLDQLEWRISTPPMWTPGPDPFEGLTFRDPYWDASRSIQGSSFDHSYGWNTFGERPRPNVRYYPQAKP